MKANRKFTLVELLLVFVIILMLVAVLAPVLSKSRAQARKTNCLSNLNQLGLAARMYSDDQKYFPDTLVKDGPTKQYWCTYFDGAHVDMSKGLLYDYVKNYAIYRCPQFELTHNLVSLDPDMKSTCSYGINAEYVGGTPDCKPAPSEHDILESPPAKVQEIKKPATTSLFMDSAVAASTAITESYYYWARYSFVTGNQHEARTHFRHSRFSNAVFCDGHAEDSILPNAIDNTSLSIGWPSQDICERE